MSEPKTLLSVCDYSGIWSGPYEDAGYNVIRLDVKRDSREDLRRFCVEYIIDELGIDDVDGLLLAPPCTDFTISGNQYWEDKDADGRTEASVELVNQCLRCVEYFNPDFWSLENPIGRLPRLVPELGKPWLWQPWQFAGYVQSDLDPGELQRLEQIAAGAEVTKADVALVKRSNRYTKATCLWGRFNRPAFDPLPPIRCCRQGSWLQMLGGRSEATKAARSETPAGFARAFFAANCWTPKQQQAWDAERAARWCFDMLDRDPRHDPVTVMDADEHPGVTDAELREAFDRLYRAPKVRRRAKARSSVDTIDVCDAGEAPSQAVSSPGYAA